MNKPTTVLIHGSEVALGDTVWSPCHRGPQGAHTIVGISGMSGERLLRFHNGASLWCGRWTFLDKIVE